MKPSRRIGATGLQVDMRVILIGELPKSLFVVNRRWFEYAKRQGIATSADRQFYLRYTLTDTETVYE